ncbi:hypothetical protein EMIHUDRAFT_219941 [Emiliania huxleyi CCMP1516]|uniref:Uncharacterized protein n=2 Tax=Emiliania huxleyi TaxID=2903 RepID=A0A0D3I3I4_EMIH1|nr:hypothetical protein EMIHUDRAFT_219941 [Emiliania huxleyi CCMP1516]EOD05819.1 hypothetical protein EMIHUDRAFT_219941 [Emiliania huxleyi CCMP1516]|eukprot:XP_005758248.1 hypothetical protein EMIHUDRAFT_219941 [Emiliania huxleyi CCMP1516]
MTASVRLVHEGCGSGHITVDGADNDLRNALAIAWHGATGTISRPLRGITSRSVALAPAGAAVATDPDAAMAALAAGAQAAEPAGAANHRVNATAPLATKTPPRAAAGCVATAAARLAASDGLVDGRRRPSTALHAAETPPRAAAGCLATAAARLAAEDPASSLGAAYILDQDSGHGRESDGAGRRPPAT